MSHDELKDQQRSATEAKWLLLNDSSNSTFVLCKGGKTYTIASILFHIGNI